MIVLANRGQMEAIGDVALNLLKGNIIVPTSSFKLLKPHTSKLLYLTHKGPSLKQKKEVLNQKGGFLPALDSPIAPLALDLLIKVFKMMFSQKMMLLLEHLLQSVETEHRLTAPPQLTPLTHLEQDMKSIMDSSLVEGSTIAALSNKMSYQARTPMVAIASGSHIKLNDTNVTRSCELNKS